MDGTNTTKQGNKYLFVNKCLNMDNGKLQVTKKKTKVLFAFGMHGTDNHPSDKGFFNSAIQPFIEEQVVRGGKKAVIVHELVVYDRFIWNNDLISAALDSVRCRSNQKAEAELRSIKRRIRKIQSEVISEVEADLRKLDSGTWPLGLHTWGFEDLVVEINSRSRGSVANVAEHQEPDNIIALFKADALSMTWNVIAGNMNIHPDERLQTLTEMYKQTAIADRMRDISVLKQIGRLSRADPERVIIVPRGSLHFPMVHLADRSKFDIETRYGFKGNIERDTAWMFKAIAGYYTGKMDDGQLRNFLAKHMKSDEEKRAAKRIPKVIEF